MVYLIGVISLISLGFNVLIYRRITATYILGSVEELQLVTVDSEPFDSQPEQIEAHDPQPATATATQEVYSAWTNQKEIPWIPPIAPPEPIIKAPNRGPLARPDGFV